MLRRPYVKHDGILCRTSKIEKYNICINWYQKNSIPALAAMKSPFMNIISSAPVLAFVSLQHTPWVLCMHVHVLPEELDLPATSSLRARASWEEYDQILLFWHG